MVWAFVINPAMARPEGLKPEARRADSRGGVISPSEVRGTGAAAEGFSCILEAPDSKTENTGHFPQNTGIYYYRTTKKYRKYRTRFTTCYSISYNVASIYQMIRH